MRLAANWKFARGRSGAVRLDALRCGLIPHWAKEPANDQWLYLHDNHGEPNEFAREIHTQMPVILPTGKRPHFQIFERNKSILSEGSIYHAPIACDVQSFPLLDYSTCGRTAGVNLHELLLSDWKPQTQQRRFFSVKQIYRHLWKRWKVQVI
jgi:hypothetical protein